VAVSTINSPSYVLYIPYYFKLTQLEFPLERSQFSGEPGLAQNCLEI